MNAIQYNRKTKQFNIPLFIHIELTEKCPLRCSQCYCDLVKGQEIEWDYCEQIIKEAGEWGIPRILLTGGEPLLYPKFMETLKLIADLGMDSAFSTSGVGITERRCEELKANGVKRVYVSLNGSAEEIHNRSRDRYSEAVNAIKLLKKAGIWCGINWVARGDNIEDFSSMVKLALELGVDNIDILSNKPDQSGHLVSPVDSKMLERLVLQARPYYDSGLVTVELCYPELSEKLNGHKVPVMCRTCLAGRLFMEVNVDKSFSSCRHMGNKTKAYKTMREFWTWSETDNGKEKGCIKAMKEGGDCCAV